MTMFKVISSLLLALTGFYLMVYAGKAELGMSLQPATTGWYVHSIDKCATPPCEVQQGDIITRAGSVSYQTALLDRRVAPFVNHPGEWVEVEIVRDGQPLTAQWQMPEPDMVSPRLLILAYIVPLLALSGFVYWRIPVCRVSQRGKLLMILALQTYALFLTSGILSSTQLAWSSLVMHAVVWIQAAVMIDLHYEMPYPPLGKKVGNMRIAIYAAAGIMALLEMAQVLPLRAYAAGILIQVIVTALLLFWRLAQRVAVRPVLIMLMGGAVSWLPGLAWLSAPIGTPNLLYTALVSTMLLTWPVCYIYANYRGKIGALERTGRRLVTGLGFVSLGTVAMMLLAFFVGVQRNWTPQQIVANAVVAIFILIGVVAVYRPLEMLVNLLLYGRMDRAIHLMTDRMAEQLTRLSEETAIEEYITEFCHHLGIEKTALYQQQPEGFQMIFSLGGVQQEDVARLGAEPCYLAPDHETPHWARMVLPLVVEGELLGYWLCGSRQDDDFYSPDHLVRLKYIVNGLAAGLKIKAQREALSQQMDVLLRQERMAALGRMAASIAHQINNPLQIVIGSLEAYGGYGEPGLDSPLLKKALEKSLYLGEIVKSITLFVRPGSGHGHVVDVNDTVQKALMLAAERIKEKRIEVNVSLGGNVQACLSSPADLIQVITNLLDNACDAMSEYGRLELKTCSNGTTCVIRITDDGVGMTQNQMDHMYEPFFTTKTQGSGFGLAVAYSIIERNKGSIEVKSKPNEGSSFELRIPKGDSTNGKNSDR